MENCTFDTLQKYHSNDIPKGLILLPAHNCDHQDCHILLRVFPWKSTFETSGAFILGMVSVQELRTLKPESAFFLCIQHHGFVVFMSILECYFLNITP